ncbi:unnamed protein product [Musa banksii]
MQCPPSHEHTVNATYNSTYSLNSLIIPNESKFFGSLAHSGMATSTGRQVRRSNRYLKPRDPNLGPPPALPPAARMSNPNLRAAPAADSCPPSAPPGGGEETNRSASEWLNKARFSDGRSGAGGGFPGTAAAARRDDARPRSVLRLLRRRNRKAGLEGAIAAAGPGLLDGLAAGAAHCVASSLNF